MRVHLVVSFPHKELSVTIFLLFLMIKRLDIPSHLQQRKILIIKKKQRKILIIYRFHYLNLISVENQLSLNVKPEIIFRTKVFGL